MKTRVTDPVAPAPDAGSTGDRLSAMPTLFRDLMDQPLKPLTRARLPARSAVYLFYMEDEPIHVGSPPHIEALRVLGSSVRLSLSIRAHREPGQDRLRMSVGSVKTPARSAPPVSARWLDVADTDDRMLLELYAAQALGLSVSHPRIKRELA